MLTLGVGRGGFVPKKLQRNITAIYALAFFQSFMVIVPVLVPFFAAKGLSLAEIFYLQAIFATTIVLLEAPSGYFADLFGRKLALVVGAFLHAVGYLLLNFADDLGSLICLGVFALFFAQIVINVGMNLGLTPITGLTLPLVSTGGSSLVSLMICLGLVESVASSCRDRGGFEIR